MMLHSFRVYDNKLETCLLENRADSAVSCYSAKRHKLPKMWFHSFVLIGAVCMMLYNCESTQV